MQDIISEGVMSRFFLTGMKPDKVGKEEVLYTILFRVCSD